MTKKVFVLGAGFSKAIEGAMPLMTELHTEVFERLKGWKYFKDLEEINSKINGNIKDIEKLLSFLAEKQIWQDYSESNEHNTLYEKLKEKISEVIEQKEREFKILEADDWILKLFLNIIGQNIDIITFNYDQLVEKIIYHFPNSKSQTSIYNKNITLNNDWSMYIPNYMDFFIAEPIDIYSDNQQFDFYDKQRKRHSFGISLCFKKLEEVKKAILFNSTYKDRHYRKMHLKELIGGKNSDWIGVDRFIQLIDEEAYKLRFRERNQTALLKIGLSLEEIDTLSSKLCNFFKCLDILSGNEHVPIYPIHFKTIVKFPINHIGDRGGFKEEYDANIVDDINFNLFKLHGSVNWYTKPNFGNYYYVPDYDDSLKYKIELKDLQRLIVPPVANKSNLYEDSLFGAIWKGAYEKLKQADEVYFLGYSLPETDLQAKYLFQTGIKKDAKIFVVNKKGEENKYKNTFAGFANLNVKYCTADENPIKTFAENHEGFYS